jgi:hypothetical protein
MFEFASVSAAKRYIADFPLTRAGLIEWCYRAGSTFATGVSL